MTEVQTHSWTASDGVDLAWRELGQGRPVILLHGLFSDAQMNWIKFGHAAAIAARGFRVIMTDLRAHGLSAKPHEPAAYPKGILARDLVELIAHLGVTDYRPRRLFSWRADDGASRRRGAPTAPRDFWRDGT